jgi:site-specific recombinase XerD
MLDKFESYLKSINISRNTITAYVSDVRQFLEFIRSESGDINSVNEGFLLRFLEHMTMKELKGSTKRRKIEAVKAFYNAMKKKGIIEENPIIGFSDMPKSSDGHMKVLSEMEYRSLRDVVRSTNRHSNVRDYAILELALQTGLRVSEVCSLSLDDLELSTKATVGYVTVRHGKGGKDRVVTLNEAAERSIKAYLAMRPKTATCDRLFLSNRLGPCNPVVIGAVFKGYMRRAGIDGASFHSLRHTFATHSLRKGTNIIVVQEALGHKSLTTTQKYLHFIREMMDEQLTKNAL